MDKTRDQPTRKTSGTASESKKMIDSIIAEKQAMFDFFGKSHMLMLAGLFVKSESPWRFSEIKDETEIPQTTLSARLSELVEEDLIIRRSYDEIPPRVEYEATQKLRGLGPIIKDLLAWLQDAD